MDNVSFGYREVTPFQELPSKCSEFTLNTGGTQSTLQDFKVAERKGGYTYKDQKKYYTRNRFIYWRVLNDIVELHEQSLDISLTGNSVRYKFTDTPVLDGISVWEVPGTVLVLVPTVSSVHRLSFPHPDLIHNREHSYPRGGAEYTAPSIFADASLSDARNPISFHVINNVHSSGPPPHASASGLSPNEEDCLFALANASGSILLIRMNAMTGAVSVMELNEHSDALMTRIFSRALSRSKTNEDCVAVSMLMHTTEDDTVLLALCRDGNIRAWSTSRHSCTIITRFDPNCTQGAQNHVLKKAVGSEKELILGVLHCFVSHSVIHILEATDPTLRMGVVESVPILKNNDVGDFAVTGGGEVWVLLSSAAGETNLAVWRSREWQECVLETPWSRQEIPMDPDLDAKQTYLDFLFHPGRFSVSVINRALNVYRRATIISDSGISTQVLKDRVCGVVDADVRGEMRERECSADELAQLQISAWQKFTSCVIEYHESGSRPLGLMVMCHKVCSADKSQLYRSTCEDPSMVQDDSNQGEDDNDEEDGEWVTSGAVLIKKSHISLIRPMDVIESIAFNQDDISRDEGVSPNLTQLISVIIYLGDNLPEDCKQSFDRSLRQLHSPIQTVSELYSRELSMSEEETLGSLDLPSNVAMNLERIKDLETVVIEFLDIVDVGQPDLGDAEPLEGSRWLLHLGHLYSSQLGISLAATSLSQIIQVRYDLCRSLLILEHMLQTKMFQQFQSNPRQSQLSQAVVERTAHLTSCYFLLMWISETPVYPVPYLENVETSISMLKLKEERAGLLMSRRPRSTNVTLLHLFLQSTASATVRLILSRKEMPSQVLPVWRHSLVPFLHALTQLIWPVCSNTIFPEFLLFSGQQLLIQEYTRLLSKWCHNNSYTRKFIAACSLMDSGEHLKAFDLFNRAADGVLIDDFLRRRVVRSPDSLDRLLVLYYVQVMKLFEHHGLHDLVVELAESAISVAKPDEPEIATLHSVAFLHRLELGQYTAAYDSMLNNPDAERRRHCLQQLVVSLVDARKLNILMSFSYDGVRLELERIVEARARSMNVLDNPYYNFLFAYHAQRGSMRKAGCIVYEQALRLSSESTAKALTQQSRCLVAAINCLTQVKAEYAWIVKPVFASGDEMMDIGEGAEVEERQMEILELKDLQKDLAMCQARLKLHSMDPDHPPLVASSPLELVAVLSGNGLYKEALKMCNLLGLNKSGVLSNLAACCVRLDESPSEEAWDWIRENDPDDLGCGSASTMAWRLLEVLLLKNEETVRSSSHHKEVTKKLLHLGVFLPNFLVESYKKRNAAELLRLLLSAGRLVEATDIAVEYIEALLGKGKERFGLATSLLPQNPAVWAPHNTFDRLSLELETHAPFDSEYAELHDHLKSMRDKYLKMVESTSNDKMKLLQEEAARMVV